MEEKENYDIKKIEAKWKKYWEEEKIYKFRITGNLKKNSPKKIYSIDTPPPTVSGKMHIGHAFSYAQQDFIARFRRMNSGVFYPFGTDDNGLPTERLIERRNNVKSKEMTRADFIKLCLESLKKIIPDFIDDWKTLGISSDYDIYYSTIDDNSRSISQKSFIELFKKNEIYTKEFPTIWCPECQTSIAQAELEDKEQESFFSTLKFSADGKELLIATTRPELLPACVSVFVNPEDKRYKNLVGKKARVPLFNFEVPILADNSADMEKGTGVLMVCSYGDKFDVDAINRHKLKPRIIISEDGRLNIKAYEGLKIKEARKKILEDLKKKDLVADEKKISHTVNTHDKCGTEIEFIPAMQWFIKILDKKKQLINQGKKIRWHPGYMFKRYENWINGLEWDWSISRDRYFGIPIPAWHCRHCNKIIPADEKELPVDPIEREKKCPECGNIAEPEKRVLDTWATSSLTPQIASSLINNKIKIPFSLRPQAHDIIRTWAFYTITKSFIHEKKLPWDNIMISGFVTLQGEKMSKSKGNVIEPKEVFEKYGADALRYWAASSKLGEDLDYQEKELASGKKFVIKMWNAARFVSQSLSGKKPGNLEETDRLFISKLNNVIKSSTLNFENYEYSKAKQDAVDFFWHDFCDNYLEIVKKRFYNGSNEEKNSASYALYYMLLSVLKIMAPITPYITEEIYQNYFRKFEKEKSIHISKWPEKIKIKENESDGKIFDLLLKVISDVRMEKTNAKKSMKSGIILTLEKEIKENLNPVIDDLQAVTNAREIKTGKFKVEFV